MANMSFFLIVGCLLIIEAQSQSDYYYKSWCGHSLQYLDDKYCVKKFPPLTSNFREFTCPLKVLDEVPEGYVKDGSLKFVDVDTTTLSPLVTSGANACVVLTKRVKRNGEVKLYNKYFCSSEESAKVAFETWSSSKIFAISNAAGHLRTNETRCDPMELGVNGYTSGKHGKTALGDLATVVCSYDTTAGYSSNSLSSYFHDLGWRDRIHDLVNSDWIGLEGLSLGGNYGEATPSDLSFVLSSVNDKSCSVDKDPWPKVYSNSLSPLAAAEMARRIALYREVDPNYRFPGMTWADAQSVLYGAESSLLFPGQSWGGMTADTSIFLQSSLNLTWIDEVSNGNWRIFSKMGCGWSTSRYVGEIIDTAYACLPTDTQGQGWEFTVSIRGSIPQDTSLLKVEQQVLIAMQQVVQAIVSGALF